MSGVATTRRDLRQVDTPTGAADEPRVQVRKEISTTMARKPTSRPSPSRAARAPATAESMATKQKEIAVSEFFAKNRHLLGFDNPRKALLTTVKEAVDNSLDACEEAGILPTIHVTIEALNGGSKASPDRRSEGKKAKRKAKDEAPALID